MLIAEMRHRLQCLGWKVFDEGRRLENGQWCLLAVSCGHTLIVLGDTRREVWSAVCSMAMKLTRDGLAKPE
jgi:hypothetical protein